MLPVIALVGRPNVGKSTLFNQLTRSRDALVADFSGLTRDRKYGEAEFNGARFIVVDTGGALLFHWLRQLFPLHWSQPVSGHNPQKYHR